jgi:protein-tyrosine phosphatase
MDEVADGLFVGTLKDAGDEALIQEHSIVNIISLTHGEPNGGFSSDLTVENIPMKDGPRNDQQKFDKAVTYVLACLKTGDNLLVHCSAGASRSPAVAATALALYDEVRLEAAFEQVSKHRSAVDPHEAVVQQAARVYTQHCE